VSRFDIPEWLDEGMNRLGRNYRVQTLSPAMKNDWYGDLMARGYTQSDFELGVRRCIDDPNIKSFPSWAEFFRKLPRREVADRHGNNVYKPAWGVEGWCLHRARGQDIRDPEEAFRTTDFEEKERIVAAILSQPMGSTIGPDGRRLPGTVHTRQQVAFIEALVPGSYEGFLAMNALKAAQESEQPESPSESPRRAS
jgi:hypothetical protein